MKQINYEQIKIAHNNLPISDDHVRLVERSAKKLLRRLPDSVELGDLVGNGYIGLLDAMGKYDVTKNDNFAAYAEIRIRGAMLDGLRSMDWVPRSVRQKAHHMQRASDKIFHKTGKLPTVEELAHELEITTDTLRQWQQETARTDCLSTDSLDIQWEDDKAVSPEKNLEKNETIMLLGLAMARLNEKQQQVMSLYYLEDLTLKEVGEVLEVTESRVCQIHSEGLKRLKKILKSDRVKLEQMPFRTLRQKSTMSQEAA
jgi:RNA polymerase sigma factor for flagellar operon FliA